LDRAASRGQQRVEYAEIQVNGCGLQPFASGGLAPEKESLGVFSFAADFKRAKVLVPSAFGRVRLRFAPQFQSIQVFNSDSSLGKPIK
jgi:hypothetical protein